VNHGSGLADSSEDGAELGAESAGS
jgi:hypothetical protein